MQINEITEPKINQTVINIAREIKQQCSDYLNAVKYKNTRNSLYRGTNDSRKIFTGKPYAKRRPKDSNKVLNDKLNLLLKNHSVIARRDNSIFCTSDINLAEEFGHVYEIFPINGFHYTFPEVDDLTLELCNKYNHIPWIIINPKFLIDIKQLADIVINGSYDDKEKYAVPNKFDIENYLTLLSIGVITASYRKFLTPVLAKKWPESKIVSIDYDKFVKYNQLQIDKNLIKAIKNNFEVWINGKFIAVSIEHPQYDEIVWQIKTIL